MISVAGCAAARPATAASKASVVSARKTGFLNVFSMAILMMVKNDGLAQR
jgi:hypothetical protein